MSASSDAGRRSESQGSGANPDEAARLYQESLDALSEQRKQMDEDLKFSCPSNPDQWPADEKRKRENDPGGARPCLVFDQTSQYVSNVAGQIEQRPPSIHAIPVSAGASQRAAEQIDGMLRYVEYASRAQAHYTRALTSAARVGVGYLTVRPQYVDRAMGYQEPRIASEGDPLKVVLDPWSQEIDGSDATFGFVLTPMSHASFERQFGKKAKKHSFGQEKVSSDREEEIILAEYWRTVVSERDMCAVRYPNDDIVSLTKEEAAEAQAKGEQFEVAREYRDKVRRVRWSLLSGAEALVEERDYPSDSIGIIPVYGYVGWSDGRMKYCGIPRRAAFPQRAYNYHMSEIRAFMSQAPKSPWLMPIRAVQGLEPMWDRASVDSRAWLPYHDVDDAGQPIAAPTRAPLAINLANHTQGAEMAIRDIQAALGMYQANLGAPSNETSGIAINERKQQGEASTAHFPAHLSASLTQVGRVCLDMLPRLIDSRRQLRVMSIDSKASSVIADPQAQDAYSDTGGEVTINPSVGRYDVRVVVGGNFATQRQQAQEAYTEMMRANPQMMPAIAPLWAQTLDVPHADKLAQVLTAMAPDAVKAILQPNADGTDTATLKAENEQLRAALQEATQLAHEAQGDADEAEAKLREAQGDQEAAHEANAIKAHEAQTKRLQVLSTAVPPEQIPALVQQTVQEMLNNPDPWPGEQPAEPEKPAPQPAAEPAGPSPELQAVLERIEALTAGLQESRGEMQELARKVSQPRKRIPVRDARGDILHVLEMAEGDAKETPLQ